MYGAHELALSTKLNELLVGMPQSYSIAEINTTTLTVTRIIPTGVEAPVAREVQHCHRKATRHGTGKQRHTGSVVT